MHKTKIVCNTGDHGMFEYMDTSILICSSSNTHQGFFFKKKKKGGGRQVPHDVTHVQDIEFLTSEKLREEW